MKQVETQLHNYNYYNYWNQPLATCPILLHSGKATSEAEQLRRAATSLRSSSRSKGEIFPEIGNQPVPHIQLHPHSCAHWNSCEFHVPPSSQKSFLIATCHSVPRYFKFCGRMWFDEFFLSRQVETCLLLKKHFELFQQRYLSKMIFRVGPYWSLELFGLDHPAEMHLSTPKVATVDSSKSTRAQAIFLDEPKLYAKTRWYSQSWSSSKPPRPEINLLCSFLLSKCVVQDNYRCV